MKTVDKLFLGIPLAIVGCGDPIIGEWNLFRENGGPPTDTYDGCTTATQMQLQVSDGFDTQLLHNFSQSGQNCYYDDEILDVYQGETIPFYDRRPKNEVGHYEIALSSSDGDFMAFSCDLDAEGELLSCSHYGFILDFQ